MSDANNTEITDIFCSTTEKHHLKLQSFTAAKPPLSHKWKQLWGHFMNKLAGEKFLTQNGFISCGTVTSFLSTSAWIFAWVTTASLYEELACFACSMRFFNCWAVLSSELTISSRYTQLRCSVISSPFTTEEDIVLVGVLGGTAKAGSDVNTRKFKEQTKPMELKISTQDRSWSTTGCINFRQCIYYLSSRAGSPLKWHSGRRQWVCLTSTMVSCTSRTAALVGCRILSIAACLGSCQEQVHTSSTLLLPQIHPKKTAEEGSNSAAYLGSCHLGTTGGRHLWRVLRAPYQEQKLISLNTNGSLH